MPISLPPAEMALPPASTALPGRLITQLTVLPVAFAAEPAIDDNPENTLAATPRGCSGWGGGALTVTGDGWPAAGGGPICIGPAGAVATAGGGSAPDATGGTGC